MRAKWEKNLVIKRVVSSQVVSLNLRYVFMEIPFLMIIIIIYNI